MQPRSLPTCWCTSTRCITSSSIGKSVHLLLRHTTYVRRSFHSRLWVTHFSHKWCNWSSPSFFSTTLRNFQGTSDLLSSVSPSFGILRSRDSNMVVPIFLYFNNFLKSTDILLPPTSHASVTGSSANAIRKEKRDEIVEQPDCNKTGRSLYLVDRASFSNSFYFLTNLIHLVFFTILAYLSLHVSDQSVHH